MATIFEPSTQADLIARVETLGENASKRWGRMSVQGMVCHLTDAFLMVLGERPSQKKPTLVERTLIRFVALHTPVPWPRGAKAPDVVDQERGGTQPGDFGEDKVKLRTVIQRFATEAQSKPLFHPIFGELSPAELGRWAYRHVDHHLRQFRA